MNAEILERIGLALYGSRWQSELARGLGTDARTLRFWAAGARKIPPWVAGSLIALAEQRRQEIASAIGLVALA